MAKKDRRRDRISLLLPVELNKKFNDYCIAFLSKRGFVHDVKPKILRVAVQEFLEKHAKDFDIEL